MRAVPLRERSRHYPADVHDARTDRRRPLRPRAAGRFARGRRSTHRPRSSPSASSLLTRSDRSAPSRSDRISYTQERTIDMRRTWYAVVTAAIFFTTSAHAQQPTQRQMDSLAAQVRLLRARLDSALAAMARRPLVPAPAAGAPVGDDLARLRAAASASAGAGVSDTTRAADTLTQAMGRERNQAQLARSRHGRCPRLRDRARRAAGQLRPAGVRGRLSVSARPIFAYQDFHQS